MAEPMGDVGDRLHPRGFFRVIGTDARGRPIKVPTMLVICGRSEALKRRLDELAAARPPNVTPALHVVGYTTEMDEYMAAADLLVGNPGASRAPKPWRAASPP